MIGIILAGGRATRLGPLAAQLNKSLVTVGAKPMLIRQVQQLRKAGCTSIGVVVSPGSKEQVECVLERAGIDGIVRTAVQRTACGPGDALYEGLDALSRFDHDDEVMVMTADTLLDIDLSEIQPRTVVVAPAPSERSWCYHEHGQWRDGIRERDELVAVGVYRFTSVQQLFLASRQARQTPRYEGEVQLSAVLNLVEPMYWEAINASDWHDVGDVPALAHANREHFIARDFHGVSMTEPGVILKTGVTSGEVDFMLNPPGDSKLLVPRAWPLSISETREHGTGYYMEYVDMPTLAELWLYWPSVPDMWRHVSANLAEMLRIHLWSKLLLNHGWQVQGRAHAMFVDKLLERYDPWPEHLPRGPVRLNKRAIHTGREVIMKVAQRSATLVQSTNDYAGYVHGDPTFSNVLWSLKAGTFKLLDPRGDFGAPGPEGDYRYDLAKIANGPALAAVMHDLFTVFEHGDRGDLFEPGDRGGLPGWTLNLWPKRPQETAALHRPLAKYLPTTDLQILKANQLLASAPLHDTRQSQALYLMGCRLAADLAK